jgi:hypothetical protein
MRDKGSTELGVSVTTNVKVRRLSVGKSLNGGRLQLRAEIKRDER